jgi:hypothetical protein
MLQGGLRWNGATIKGMKLHADTVPTGAALTVEVRNGATPYDNIFLPAGTADRTEVANFTPPVDTRLRFYATGVGSTVAGAGVTISLLAETPDLGGLTNLLTVNQQQGTGGATFNGSINSVISDSSVTYNSQPTFKGTATTTGTGTILLNNPPVSVTAGLIYSLEVFAKIDVAVAHSVWASFMWVNGSGTWFDTSSATSVSKSDTNFNRMLIASITAPAGAVACWPAVSFSSTASGRTYHAGGWNMVQGVLS